MCPREIPVSVAMLLLVSGATLCLGSAGDQAPFYKRCVRESFMANCRCTAKIAIFL